MKTEYDVIVIGGGPSGLSAALEAKKNGAESVLILERNNELGGILLQCVHNGFGSVNFKKDLPGPDYAARYVDEVLKSDIDVLLDTMVLDLTPLRTIYATSSRTGFHSFTGKAVVLAMGCRERTRAQIRVPGSRPAGVFTAGTVQRMVNIEGFMPGKNFVILGSGDIGMIMARRLTLEGAKVIKVIEALPFLTGLRRNYVQCLQDFNIPLELSTTVNRVIGKNRVEAVQTIRLDESMQAVNGTDETITCDTLLLSVGLIPENELSRKAGVELDPLTGGPFINQDMATNVPGIFAAGNVTAIYDLADYVSLAGNRAGKSAALFAAGKYIPAENKVEIKPGQNIRSILPQIIEREAGNIPILLELRVSQVFEGKTVIDIMDGNTTVMSFKENYARPAEMITLKVSPEKLFENLPVEVRNLTIRAVAL